MNQKTDYIAVFDSGVGGISVLRQLVKLMPGERFLYYGDSANAPYGTKTPDQVRELTLAATEKLLAEGIKALVIACNTATAAAVETLRARFPRMIIVGIEPAVKQASDHFPGGTVGVMATPLTSESQRLRQLEARFRENCTIIDLPTPGLAELVEGDLGDSAQCEALLRPLLEPWKGRLDAVVLGCTHYPFASPAIRRILGDSIELVDGGEGTARETRRRLLEADLLWEGTGEVRIENSLGRDMILRSRALLERQ